MGFKFAPRIGLPGGGVPLLLMCVLVLAAISAHGQVTIRSLTDVIEGHQVGGVTIDLVGNIYVADFGDVVWKLTPEGERHEFASGFYGASGNAIDNQGDLLQSNFYGNSITKIDRKGETKPFITSGLSGPVGIAINRQTGDVYVANCGGNSITKITADLTVSTFATSELFKCPNGLAFDKGGNLYVANFRNNRVLKIDPKGGVVTFATVSEKGLGHLCFKTDRFYVTAYESHEIYELGLDGTAKRILGNGERGVVDGQGSKARLSFPNGIACDPWAPRLYVNEYANASETELPRRAIIREIRLDAGK
jgi:DNA-binding beta-propeller fold protein YncE